MKFQIGMENGDEDRSVAWVLGHPGCFAYGKDSQEALRAAPEAIAAYKAWILAKNGSSWIPDDGIEVILKENYDVFWVNEEYELEPGAYAVNAWFLHDFKPLTAEEIDQGAQILSWSRADLMDTICSLDEETLRRTYPGERWSIEGIARHIGSAEWWYLDRLGLAFPRQEIPDDPLERLEKVRRRLVEVLPSFAGLSLVVGKDAEFWSPRKVLRRAAWHERDHTWHIHKLAARSNTETHPLRASLT